MAKKTVLYFAPHQDDELLTMGLDICRSVAKKWDVHVILCADGSKSYVRGLLNDGKSCSKHEGEHCYELSVEEFIAARDREFVGSCMALGVPRENIHIPEKRAVDGSVTVEEAEAIMLHYLEKLGKDAYVCTINSGNGDNQHRDHKAVGKAAENLLNRGVIREVKSFVEPYLYHKIIANSWILPVDPYVEQATEAESEKLKNAIGSYSLWDPQQQRYAVGYHSVTTEFNDFMKERNHRFVCLAFDEGKKGLLDAPSAGKGYDPAGSDDLETQTVAQVLSPEAAVLLHDRLRSTGSWYAAADPYGQR